MDKFQEYTLTIIDPTTNSQADFVWPIVNRKAWGAFCVKTELGELWLESGHTAYSGEHTTINFDQLDNYLKWLDFQLNNDLNLYVTVTSVENEKFSASKIDQFYFSYLSHQWCDSSNKWVEFKLETKTVDIAKSIVDELPDGRLVAPFWALKMKIASGGRDGLALVRKVQLSGLATLFWDATPLAAMMKKN
jgi:hypothetical protein